MAGTGRWSHLGTARLLARDQRRGGVGGAFGEGDGQGFGEGSARFGGEGENRRRFGSAGGGDRERGAADRAAAVGGDFRGVAAPEGADGVADAVSDGDLGFDRAAVAEPG